MLTAGKIIDSISIHQTYFVLVPLFAKPVLTNIVSKLESSETYLLKLEKNLSLGSVSKLLTFFL